MTSIEPLPRQPNLEHQQKLARRLLREAWAGKPDAIERVRTFLPHVKQFDSLKLHDTQLVVARGYGFETWAAMKRKIESLTKSPLELFDLAVREGDVEQVKELLEKMRWSHHTSTIHASTSTRPRYIRRNTTSRS